MTSLTSILGAGLLGLLIGTASVAHAATIDYEFSGTFDGTLGTTAYTDQNFALTLTGDTNAVTSSGGEFSNVAQSATFSVGAISGTLLGSYNDVVLNQGFNAGTIIFGQGQRSAPFFVGEGVSSGALGTYDLTKALPPTTGVVSQTPGSSYLTSAGNLVFTNISSLSFQAEVLATPLANSLTLFLTAVMALALWGFAKKRLV